MKCIKCGREIPDGELFCATCSHAPQPPQSQSGHFAKKAAPPAKQTRAKSVQGGAPAKKAQPASEPRRRRPIKLIFSLILTCLAAVALVAFIFLNWGDLALQKANLRVREADLALRESDIQELKQSLADTGALLDKANAALAAEKAENRDLKRQLSGTQSTVSQTQFDMTSQQQELEKLTQENEKLGKLAGELEQENGDLLGKLSALNATAAAYGVKADFMDRFVVFVNNDGSKYYHKFDCKDFNRKSFWAYSRKLAESSGFDPCPVCAAN